MSDEYDAFGRRKDESGLGDLGWGASADSDATTAEPAATTAAAAAPRAAMQATLSPPTGLVRSRRNPLLYVVQVLIALGIGLAVLIAVTGSNNASDSIRKSIDDFTQSGSGSGSGTRSVAGGGTSAKPPKRITARDYFTPECLRAGLRILRRKQPGKITNFSFRRDRIDLQVVRGGKTYIVDFPADAKVPEVLNSSATTSQSGAFGYAELDVRAPARLMRAANARVNRSKSDVDYFVAQKWTGAMQWGIYYKGGSPIVQGDSRGRYTRRIS